MGTTSRCTLENKGTIVRMPKRTALLYLIMFLLAVRSDDSYISHQYMVPCEEEYIPDNCNYPFVTLDIIKTGEDFERCAPSVLPYEFRSLYWGAAGRQVTYRRNFDAFSRISIIQRVLRDVSKTTLHTKVLGEPVRSPIGIAPSAAHKLADPMGEIATARAAAAFGSVMVLSTLSQTSLEDVAEAAFSVDKTAVLWMQVYIFKDRAETLQVVSRAELAGYKAIAVTVDTPHLSSRSCDGRNLYNIIRLPNLFNTSLTTSKFDTSLTFKDLEWLVKSTNLPVIAKGITSGLDAIKAIEAGAAAIRVSNHGARQLDSGRATIDVLPEITKALQNKYPETEIYLDSGVRNGWDVFKAIALGAKAVFVGRPAIWGLAIAGEEGVAKMLKIIKSEFNESMTMAGYSSPDQIREEGKQYPIVAFEKSTVTEGRCL